MNYNISDLDPAEVLLLGEALDALPHGRVQKIVAKIQAQFTAQDKAESDRLAAEQAAAVTEWQARERDKITAELNASACTTQEPPKGI